MRSFIGRKKIGAHSKRFTNSTIETLSAPRAIVSSRVDAGHRSRILNWPDSPLIKDEFGKLVGAIGFEPTTPCAQGRCATRLRYAPTVLRFCSIIVDYSYSVADSRRSGRTV